MNVRNEAKKTEKTGEKGTAEAAFGPPVSSAVEGKGLSLSRRFFEAYGREMLFLGFPEEAPRIAAGLCGQGSECFGYDDAVSEDHDYDPGFCLWLTETDYERIGFRLYRAYEKLPKEFEGVKRLPSEFLGAARKGVFSIDGFYRRLIGLPRAPETFYEWLRLPEHALAEAVNGAVFCDGLGAFSAVRKTLLSYYPEDVRLKKIAARAALCAQSGQYNFPRCQKHGEREAAQFALYEFAAHASALLFLLNRSYMPYYKWRFRKLRELPKYREEAELLAKLLCGEGRYGSGEERIFSEIEQISGRLCEALRREGLSDAPGSFLEPHAYSVTERIEDAALRNLHVMDGV